MVCKMKYLVGVLVIMCFVGTVLSLECHRCWPPMEEEQCKRSTERIDCRGYKNLGYDRCVEVRYHGNKSLSRTCYQSHKCDGAKEWCRRYGPCTVRCCDYNMCNPASTITYLSVSQVLVSFAALVWINL